jgi:cyclic 2,3-diphosphoglycerate synthetase
LSNRADLADELESVDAETYVIELKAAAIDVVAEHALARGARVVLAANEIVAPGLDEQILALLERVAA